MKKLSIPKIRKQKSEQPKTSGSKKLGFKQSVSLLAVVTLGLFGVSGYYWYQSVLTDPDRVISDMLDKSMQTSGVFRTVSQEGGQNNVEQTVLMSFSPQVIAKSITNLEESSEIGKTTVTTETLGTKDADYVRYTGIDIESRTPVQRDFSQVLNVWSKRTANPETGDSTSFLNDALFVVVPFGNLNSDQRAQMKDKIDAINLYEIAGTKTEFVSGRPVINYDIALDPQKLIEVLALYVELTGVGSGAELDPEQYEGAAKLQIKLAVDVLSRHVNSIDFAGSGRSETYHGYNPKSNIDIPSQTIGTDELQTRLQALEQQR